MDHALYRLLAGSQLFAGKHRSFSFRSLTITYLGPTYTRTRAPSLWLFQGIFLVRRKLNVLLLE